jgi:hypothetical protein
MQFNNQAEQDEWINNNPDEYMDFILDVYSGIDIDNFDPEGWLAILED